MTERNIDVVERFVQGDIGYNGHTTSSRENALYSYNAKIAEWRDGEIVVHDGWDGFSRTTSTHFHYLHEALDESDVEWTATHEPKNKGDRKSRWY